MKIFCWAGFFVSSKSKSFSVFLSSTFFFDFFFLETRNKTHYHVRSLENEKRCKCQSYNSFDLDVRTSYKSFPKYSYLWKYNQKTRPTTSKNIETEIVMARSKLTFSPLTSPEETTAQRKIHNEYIQPTAKSKGFTVFSSFTKSHYVLKHPAQETLSILSNCASVLYVWLKMLFLILNYGNRSSF